MILRVFAFIWGATLVTLLLFLSLIFFVDLTPPKDVWRKAELEILEQELALIYDREGPAGTRAFWQQIAPAHPSYGLEADSSCTHPSAIGVSGDGCLRLVDLGSADDTLALLRPVTLPLILGAVVSAMMAIFLSRWLTRPIREVSRGLKAIAEGHLETRMPASLRTSNREMQELGKDFDLAAERLQALSEGRNRLFHDISHEIRSPLARLRAAVGLIEINPARGSSLAGRMEGDIARLDQLVNEILTLARLERGERLGEFQRIDLLDLVENIIADANFEGRVRDVKVQYSGANTLELHGNLELLHRACENVIRNALAHSPQGGVVAVTGRLAGETIVLEIADHGVGVPEADLKNIFNPFVRVDEATPSVGIGLGLAIASSALHSHGGSITARNRQPHGLLIEIVIPTLIGNASSEL
ncbi:ATP-binding protein [Tropicimonas sp. IMCC34043]|uniref:HAMP domain-containing sensor histidine kinase n=1 Tax=Tropicimonas sp. IMCC34043 TaxID=2248760 RepID=UPI000E2337B1|nr:ATP-binding protein [Tropicimonas sp. IMCC34043]